MNGIGAVLGLQARARRNALTATHVLAHRRRQRNDADTATHAAHVKADLGAAAPTAAARD